MTTRPVDRRGTRLRCLLGVGLALLTRWPANPAGAQDLSPMTQRRVTVIDELAPALMESCRTPGCSVALVADRRIVWAKGYGIKAANGTEPVDTETLFEACSMSKPVVAFAVLMLAERGKLELDRPLDEYLEQPYLPDEPLSRRITARMVLNHTSGLPNWREGGWRNGGPLSVLSEPGTEFRYSGEGFWYLQQVVEQVVGEPLEPWIQRTLLQPLGMTRSSFVWQPDRAAEAAAGHEDDGEIKTNRQRFDAANAAYTLYTTPSDYVRFVIAMMATDEENALLTRESLAAMVEPGIKTDKPGVFRGLGWAVTVRETDGFVWHSGANGTGFRCYCRFDPVAGEGVVIMTNAVGGEKLWERLVAEFDSSQP